MGGVCRLSSVGYCILAGAPRCPATSSHVYHSHWSPVRIASSTVSNAAVFSCTMHVVRTVEHGWKYLFVISEFSLRCNYLNVRRFLYRAASSDQRQGLARGNVYHRLARILADLYNSIIVILGRRVRRWEPVITWRKSRSVLLPCRRVRLLHWSTVPAPFPSCFVANSKRGIQPTGLAHPRYHESRCDRHLTEMSNIR